MNRLFIYSHSVPVAVVKSGTTYYVHTDHLGTPRVITNTSGTVMWKWDNTNAYGFNSANENVSGPLFEYNIRFSGQYFDKESGLHYNYHRMYNPELGRYMQPDPIGVAGGMNLYSYVENNPLNASDPYGLRIVRDSNGEFKFYSKNFQTLNKNTKYTEGYFLTDKNEKIDVSKYFSGPSSFINDYTTDCHGVTFTNGKYWIDNSSVDKILEEEYVKIPYENKMAGDIGVTRNSSGIIHSFKVIEENNKLYAYEKSGIGPGPFRTFQVDLINFVRPLEIYRNKK